MSDIFDSLKKLIQEKDIPKIKIFLTDLTEKKQIKRIDSSDFKKKHIESFIDTLAHELTYNYQRRDEIINGLFPEYLLQENEYMQKENAFLYKSDESFQNWVRTHSEVGNYGKYMNYTFDDQQNKDDTYTFSGHILPYIWQKYLHLDYKYNTKNPLEWIQTFSIETRKKLKTLLGKMDKNISPTTWKEVSKLTNCNILVLPYSEKLEFYKGNATDGKKLNYLIFFVDTYTKSPLPLYYPVMLNNVYLFEDISNDMKNIISHETS